MKRIIYPMFLVIVSACLLCSSAIAAEDGSSVPAAEPASARTIGLAAAAAFAIGLSILGAAVAVGRIGAAALGAAAEKPELLPRSILFVALAEGLAVLGFAIAMMLVQKI